MSENRLSVQMFEPKNGNQESFDNVLVVQYNEVGARIADYNGARAQTVADALGVQVLAVDRLMTNVPFSGLIRASREYGTKSADLFKATAAGVQEIVDNENPGRVFHTGNSAGGFAALGVAASGGVKVSGVAVSDPPRIWTPSPGREMARYARYRVWDLSRRPGNKKEIINNNVGSPASSFVTLGRLAKEMFIYGGDSYSAGSKEALGIIAKDQQSTVLVEIPEFTFTIPHGEMDDALTKLNQLAPDDRVAPFLVAIVEGVHHTHFDAYQRSAELLDRALRMQPHDGTAE